MRNLSNLILTRNMQRRRPLHAAMTEVLESRQLLSTIYVDVQSPGPTHNGATWENAYADLRQAIDASQAGDRINVADGTYKPTTGTDQNLSFKLKDDVAIYGGYAGSGATNPDARNPAAYRTILSGNIGSTQSDLDNSYHVVRGNGANSTAILDGFTITGGNANGIGIDQIGGGMFNSASSPTINECTFTGNTASRGGAIYNDDSSPKMTNCTFTDNSGTYGGAVENGSSSAPEMSNCIFSGNTASQFGGAVYNESSSSPKLVNCTLSANSASYSGGAIYNSTLASPTLTNSIVWDNTAQSGSELYPASGTATVTHSNIEGGFNGEGNIASNPLFVRAPSAGADGVWGTKDDDYGNLKLKPTSPSVDVGSNTDVSSDTDRDGKTRIVDVPTSGTAGNTVDMGAYETAAEVLPMLSINNVSIKEDGTAAVNLTITLSAASDEIVTVQYTTADDSAIAMEDYTPASGTITFNPGQTTKTLNIQPLIVNDQVQEGSEYFSVILSSPQHADISAGTAKVTIVDDATAPGIPKISINNRSVSEGDTGTTPMVFTVSLSAVSTETITMNYATANKTAKAVEDYVSKTGVLTFAPGETQKTFTVDIKGETSIEKNETFKVNLTSPVNATFADSQGIGTIVNDDVVKAHSLKVVQVKPLKTITSRQLTKVDFGTVDKGATAAIKSFKVTNDGTSTLILGKVKIPAGYKLSNGLLTTLAPGKSDTFSIQPITKTSGTYEGTVSFSTNLSKKNTFLFPVTGTIN